MNGHYYSVRRKGSPILLGPSFHSEAEARDLLSQLGGASDFTIVHGRDVDGIYCFTEVEDPLADMIDRLTAKQRLALTRRFLRAVLPPARLVLSSRKG